MNSKKRATYIGIALVILLVVVGVGYKYLSTKYNKTSANKIESQDNFVDDKPIGITKKEAIDFTVYNEAGEEVKLSDYKGKKPIVVNFWASWCPPCKYEMPFFQNATDKYSKDDIEILMVNLTDGERETKEKAMKYMSENNFKMNTVFDEDLNAGMAYRIQGVPRTLFIDREGFIINDHMGIIDEETLNTIIDNLINNL